MKPIQTVHNKQFLERKLNVCSQLLNLSSKWTVRQRRECVKQRCNVVSVDGNQQLQHYITTSTDVLILLVGVVIKCCFYHEAFVFLQSASIRHRNKEVTDLLSLKG